jgi:hypothetical protein
MFEEGKTARVARSLLSKVQAIYKKHPTMKHTVLLIENDVKVALNRIRDELKVLDSESANMVTVSIINDIHRMVEEILLEDVPEDETPKDETQEA